MATTAWLPDERSTARVRARALLAGGAPEEAAVLLRRLVAAKRPRADLHFHLAEALCVLGDRVGAREAAETYLARAPKRTAFRGDA